MTGKRKLTILNSSQIRKSGVALAGFMLLVFHLSAQVWENRAKLFISFADTHHVSPPLRDDNFSAGLFEKFFEEADPGKSYFTQDLISSFSHYKHSLNEICNKGEGTFISEVAKVLEGRARKVDSIAEAILSVPVDFSKPDMLRILPADKETWPKNDAEWATLWRHTLKESILNGIFDKYRDSVSISKERIPEIMASEKDFREKILTYIHKRVQLRLDSPLDYTGKAFLHAIACMYDPHSEYFSPREKSDFVSYLSTENLSLGILFNENEDGELSIERVLPGGPAWRSGSLNKGDVILSIKTPDGNVHDLEMAALSDLEEILQPVGRGLLTLTVRKSNGKVITVSLSKEEMKNQENTVRSLVLDGHIKVGYIYLPDFYTTWDDPTGKGCASDVAKELMKLKKENVNGIILDLRYNGGGSMKEALELAGLFIDAGPIWIGKDSRGNLKTIKDMNQGAIYSGPLMLLQNGGSASASEFLADALQDYHRAIVVGDQSYGKGTAQDINLLDKKYYNEKEGYAKVTTSRYYRLDGSSHQFTGITPDVRIRDPFRKFFSREEELSHALPNDSVVKKVYFTPLPEVDFTSIENNSQTRLKTDPLFKKIEVAAAELYHWYELDTTVSLTPEKYFDFLEKKLKAREKISEILDSFEDIGLTVKNAGFDELLLNLDEYEREAQKELQENIRKDIYLREAIYIFEEYINP